MSKTQRFQNPRLSVIIPVYNEENRIGRSLKKITEYLLTQTFQWEIILVDDKSKDHTVKKIQPFLDKYNSLRLVSLSQHRGKGGAVREGVLNAQGNYPYNDI